MNASILLASSLLNHKQKRNRHRPHFREKSFESDHSALLTTNKLNIDRREQYSLVEKDYSNIQELKHLASRLDEDNVIKLGKENIAIEKES